MNTINETRSIGKALNKDVEHTAIFLNELLSNEYALFTKTLNFHWNIKGPTFHSMHKFLESRYNETLEIMDSIAERIKVIGETPLSTVAGLHDSMSIKERNGAQLSTSQMLEDLFSTNIKIQEDIKSFLNKDNNYCDMGTEDFLVSTLRSHEMMSWMIKSHLS